MPSGSWASADSAFASALGEQREQLSRAIAVFRAALDQQDPKAIAEARARLVAATVRLRG